MADRPTETPVAKSVAHGKDDQPKKPKAPPTHPSYLDMIVEAISSLKERTGRNAYWARMDYLARH